MIFTDDAHLQERLAYWQGVLRLQDWDITARIVEPLDIENNTGRNTSWMQSGESKIRISNKDRDNWGDPVDQEQTLVHELLHLKFTIIDDKVCEDRESLHFNFYERSIDQLATALVTLDRKK